MHLKRRGCNKPLSQRRRTVTYFLGILLSSIYLPPPPSFDKSEHPLKTVACISVNRQVSQLHQEAGYTPLIREHELIENGFSSVGWVPHPGSLKAPSCSANTVSYRGRALYPLSWMLLPFMVSISRQFTCWSVALPPCLMHRANKSHSFISCKISWYALTCTLCFFVNAAIARFSTH